MRKDNIYISEEEKNNLLAKLKIRFEEHKERHEGISWDSVITRLNKNDASLRSLNEMEKSGGEPDVIDYDEHADKYTFCDCSPESPEGRRNLCYDNEALEKRKKNKPKGSVLEMADKMGVKILTEDQYRKLQTTGTYDTKTSSWVYTPADIRELGGALFCDFRYDHVFLYHNGADSYYSARGFRVQLEV